jgi:hypothetical protein
VADGARALTPIPEPPNAGLVADARYLLTLARARWERRAAIRAVGAGVRADVAALDRVLGALGEQARTARAVAEPGGRDSMATRPLGSLAEEHVALDAAEARRAGATQAAAGAAAGLTEEDAAWERAAAGHDATVAAAEQGARATAAALTELEASRRKLEGAEREARRGQRQALRRAEEREAKAGQLTLGDERAALRRSADEHRAEAARHEREGTARASELEALVSPLAAARSASEAARAALDAAGRAQRDAHAAHRDRRAALEAEGARQGRAGSEAGAEIARRLVTLGTLVNLNRGPDPGAQPLYAEIDTLRAQVAAREAEIERLRTEAQRADAGAVARGAAVLGGALALLIAVACALWALR